MRIRNNAKENSLEPIPFYKLILELILSRDFNYIQAEKFPILRLYYIDSLESLFDLDTLEECSIYLMKVGSSYYTMARSNIRRPLYNLRL